VAAAQGDTQFDTVAHARGSLTALGLAVLRAQVRSFSPYTFDPYRETYEAAEAAALPVTGDATEEQISHYSAELLQDLGQGLQARAVMALVEDARSLGPLDEAIRTAADEMGLQMSRVGRVLGVENELPRPLFRSLLRALRVVETNPQSPSRERLTTNAELSHGASRPSSIYERSRAEGPAACTAWRGHACSRTQIFRERERNGWATTHRKKLRAWLSSSALTIVRSRGALVHQERALLNDSGIRAYKRSCPATPGAAFADWAS
jgi:hypothetical protein